jgi:SAM-dependent methyltransferase
MTTRPSEANATFDTSLIDLSPKIPQEQGIPQAASTFKDSFSTTDSTPSDDYKVAINAQQGPAQIPAPLPVQSELFANPSTTKEKMPVQYVPTIDAYNAWADVYDNDGNILQSIDDLELSTLLPTFIKVVSEESVHVGKDTVQIVDFGCGTGRNTVKLLSSGDWDERLNVEATGVDGSEAMLAIAEKKLQKSIENPTGKRSWKSMHHDFLDPDDAQRPPILLPGAPKFDALISTLVLEHFPLAAFFSILASFVCPGSLVLLTNMHPDMGSKSQAGFVSTNPDGKAVKVRGTSWVHGVQETVDAAKSAGFDVVGQVGERGIEKEMIGREVGERGAKWIGIKVWYGMILRKAGQRV